MFQAKFQTFEDRSDKGAAAMRLAALRAELRKRGLDGFILPRADAHQNEYVPPSEERLAWLTGFGGSAGCAIVLGDRALLFVDGRYTLQAREQTDGAFFEVAHLVDTPPDVWIERNFPTGSTLGFDPWLHTAEGADKLRKACANAGAKLVAAEPDPIDVVWSDRPAPPLGPVVLHELRYSGEEAAAKLARIRAEMAALRADALIVSDAHNLAWTFNIRGADVAHTPLPLGFAILPAQGRPLVHLDSRKLSNAVRASLEQLADLREPVDFPRDLAKLGERKARVRLDQATGADAIARILGDAAAMVSRGPDPITGMKAMKNAAEIAGAHEAQARDGAAMCRFLAWFDAEAPKGQLTEIDAVAALESFRRDTGALKDVSFPSIAGSGPHGAIVHYRVTRKTNRKISPGELFLIDSGGQYEDGTTDITRTLPVGDPTPEMRGRFTLVLRGHIAIARAVFPAGTSGAQLDAFARQRLWEHGFDYDHGTGHGVGSYLSVHEGPARLSKLGTAPLKRGMILSNEPGYYKEGQYGIRIENLVLVAAAKTPAGAEKDLDTFETITLAPIDRRMIVAAMMTNGEIAWLDAYHARVAKTLSPLLDAPVRGWLEAATRPLARA